MIYNSVKSIITPQRYTIYLTCKFFVNYFQNIFSGSVQTRCYRLVRIRGTEGMDGKLTSVFYCLTKVSEK